MEALYLLIPLSVILVFVAIWIFFSMADGGQFDDLVGPAWRVVHDDDRPPVVVDPTIACETDTTRQAAAASLKKICTAANPDDFDSHQGI